MKVLHLIPSLYSGGAERQLQYLSEALASSAHEVHVGFVHSDARSDSPYSKKVTLHHIPVRSNADPALLVRLYRLVRAIRPQVIQTWLLQMDVAGGLIALLTRTPWVLREPSIDLAYERSWKFRVRRLVAAGCDAIVSNSAAGAEYWRKGHANRLVRVIHNAIPFNLIREVPPLPERYNTDEPTIMYAGRLVSDHYSEKNVAKLLIAVERVNRSMPCRAVIAGDGPQRSSLEQLTHELGIRSRVTFTGQLPREAVWSTMKTASVFVSVSPFEGMPNSVMEAIACGCPLVLSDIPPHRELVGDGFAIFVDHRSPEAIAAGILECLRDPSSSQRTQWGASRAEEWSIERMARAYEKLYADLLAGAL